VRATKRHLLKFLVDARAEGKSVVGYGAPCKGNTLLNYCGIRTDFLDYTVDRSPHKQGRYTPGHAHSDPRAGAHPRDQARLHPDPAVEPEAGDRRGQQLRARVGRPVRGADPARRDRRSLSGLKDSHQ
jgi:hypothetical protein